MPRPRRRLELLQIQPTPEEIDAHMLTTAQQIFKLRKQCRTDWEIALELNIAFPQVKKITEQCRDRVFATISDQIQDDRHLYVGQLNDNIRQLTVIAENAEKDCDRIAARNAITKAISEKGRIIGLYANNTPSHAALTLNIAAPYPGIQQDLTRYRELKNANGHSD